MPDPGVEGMVRYWFLLGLMLIGSPALAQTPQQHGPFDTAPAADAGQSASPVPVKGTVTTVPAANSPGASSVTPSYVQEGADPGTPTIANPGTGARGWLGGILAALGLQSDAATTGTSSSGSLIALTKQLRNLLSGPLVVQGGAAVGSPPAVPPVPVSGVDSSGNKQHVLTDTTGRVQTHDDTLAAAQAGAGVKVQAPALPLPSGAATSANQLTQSTPTETNTAIGTTSTSFGAAGNYHSLTIQAQGQPMCVTLGSGTPTAPSSGVCAVGMYLVAGQGFTYPSTTIPSSQGKAAALSTGGYLWESVQ